VMLTSSGIRTTKRLTHADKKITIKKQLRNQKVVDEVNSFFNCIETELPY